MTIYVDPLRPCTPNAKWNYSESCHLLCDGPFEELHTFAEQIGLKREWFQDSHPRPTLWHYDLNTTKRRLAIQHGVVEITARQYSTMIHEAVEHQSEGVLRHACGHQETHADLPDLPEDDAIRSARERMRYTCSECSVKQAAS
jgi:hypothetical protein